MLFDNGNTRISNNGDEGTSRGQVLRVDEQARTVTRDAERRPQGELVRARHGATAAERESTISTPAFCRTRLTPTARISQALEVDPGGNIVWGMQINAQEYRSYRMNDLYTPPPA